MFFNEKNDLLYCYDISLENFSESTFFTFFPSPLGAPQRSPLLRPSRGACSVAKMRRSGSASHAAAQRILGAGLLVRGVPSVT